MIDICKAAQSEDGAKLVIKSFNDRVQLRMEKGMTRQTAIRDLMKADPELHRAYLTAINPSQWPRAAAAPGAAAAFEASIAANIKAGIPREKAWRQAIAENPDGHRAFLDEYNAKRSTKQNRRR